MQDKQKSKQNNMFKIIPGFNSGQLAESIAEKLGTGLTGVSISHFADGEFKVQIQDSVRGCDVYIIQSLVGGAQTLMEVLQIVDAVKRASAKSIILVSPYLGWSRQDRKEQPRTPITASLVAKMLEAAGVDRLITFDLHADQIQGFYNIPVDNLRASNVLIPELKKWIDKDSVICSPDVGGTKRAAFFAKELNLPLITCYKTRERDNQVSDIKILGDVKGKRVYIVDDMIDTAGTIIAAADMLVERGATEVIAVATHGLFSKSAAHRIVVDSSIDAVFVTDTNPSAYQSSFDPISVDEYLAQVIDALDNNRSLSDIQIHS